VNITSAGLVTYSVEFAPCRGFYFVSDENPVITLVSAAFSGCSLTAGPSNFQNQGNMGMDFNNTVTASLVGSTLSLAAEWLSLGSFTDSNFLTASWQLENCPVRPVRCCWGRCRAHLKRIGLREVTCYTRFATALSTANTPAVRHRLS
jgi:hypothetical protein